jgi:hypothetical protein
MDDTYPEKEDLATAGTLLAKQITRDIQHCHRFSHRWAQLHWYPAQTTETLLRDLYKCLLRTDSALSITGVEPSLILYNNSTCQLPLKKLTHSEAELLSIGLQGSVVCNRLPSVFSKAFYKELHFTNLILSILSSVEQTILVTHDTGSRVTESFGYNIASAITRYLPEQKAAQVAKLEKALQFSFQTIYNATVRKQRGFAALCTWKGE